MNGPVVVTAALPYANGSIHIGHLVEYLMTDIFVRAQRLQGREALYICADDTHGTAIELNAAKAGVTPEAFVARFAEEHVRDFSDFGVCFDHFGSTHTPENRAWVEQIYQALHDAGHVERRSMEQLYDPKAGRFLPDRFVKGTCPKCDSKDQYGDVCEVCHATYRPTDLTDPFSVITGERPELRQSEHYFVRLSAFQDLLRGWVDEPGRLQGEVRNFVGTWLKEGLQDWCISRDAPYFGFEIPGAPDKYFYVWMDAPVGYVSATECWAKAHDRMNLFDAVWRRGEGEVVHVIGRDITYFHTLFWPAMLTAVGLQTPTRVQVHGMLLVDGEKMSKSRGTFLNARTYLSHLDPIYLRYYYAAKIGRSTQDIDLNLTEFVDRVNAELVNNLANLVSRGASFLANKLDGQLSAPPEWAAPHFADAQTCAEAAIAAYNAFDSAEAMRQALAIAQMGNKIFQDRAPWTVHKTDPESARAIVTVGLNLARAAAVLVAPAVPAFAETVYRILGLGAAPTSFDEAKAFDLFSRPIGQPERLVERITKKQVDKMIDSAKTTDDAKPKAPAEPQKAAPAKEATKAPGGDYLHIDDFLKVQLRVGCVKTAEYVEGADKLLRLEVDLGEDKPRQIFAGIREAYEPDALIDKKVAVVANLKPRKMRFGISEGMILAGGPGGKNIWLPTFPDDTPVGSEVR